MSKGLVAANGEGDDDLKQWAADDDVYVPEARAGRASILSVPSAAGRRASSLGTLHHAGHSARDCAHGGPCRRRRDGA